MAEDGDSRSVQIQWYKRIGVREYEYEYECNNNNMRSKSK